MPRQSPSFSQFLYSDSNNVGFAEARRKLELYANYFNRGVIPQYLACVQRAGGAESIRSRWNQTNSNGYNLGDSSVNRNNFNQAINQTVIPTLVNSRQTRNVNTYNNIDMGSSYGSNYMVSSNLPNYNVNVE